MINFKQSYNRFFLFVIVFVLTTTSLPLSVLAAEDNKYDPDFYAGNLAPFYGTGACSPDSSESETITTAAPTVGGDGIYSIVIESPRNSQYHGDDYSPRQSGVSVGNDGYSKQNSIAGIKHARAKGFKSIDLDLTRSTDGIYFAIHRSEVKNKPWAAVDRYNNTRKFKISQLSDLLKAAAENNIQTNIELKVYGRSTWSEADMVAIANMANSTKTKATIKGNGNNKNISNALTIARTHGFWVRTVQTTGRSNGWIPRKFYPPTTSAAPVSTPAETDSSSSAASCCPTPSNTVTPVNAIVEGGDNEEKAWKYLTGKGLSAEQTAGIMGNMAIESGFDPLAKNGSLYRGISQWDTKSRWPALVTWAKAPGRNLDINKFDTQIQYTYVEANNRKNIAGIKKYNDVAHAAWYWGRYFEIAIVGGSTSNTPLTNVQHLDKRTEAAKRFYAQYKGTTGSSISNASTSSSCGAESASFGDASCSNVDAKPPDDFGRTTFPGTSEKTDKRTLYLVKLANSCLKELGEKPITVVQGSYCEPSCASASKSSHNKGATIDIRTRDRGGKDKIMKLLKVLREVGFAAWYRDGGDPGGQFAGNEHIHAVALGAPLSGPNAPGSTDQLILYCTGGDGLKGGQKDRQLAIVGRPLPKWALTVKPACKSNIVRSV